MLLSYLNPRINKFCGQYIAHSVGKVSAIISRIRTTYERYGKILSTFDDFCSDFSRVVYCCYLRNVRSTWARLALKTAVEIRKCTLDVVGVCIAWSNAAVHKTDYKNTLFRFSHF